MGTVGKGYLEALLYAATLALTAVFGSHAHAQIFSADAVKAAFLHRFASYVEWPPDALAEGPFVIAVADAGAVAQHLDELLPRITVQGRRAIVRRVARPAELQGVHILYVGTDLLARTRELREAAQRQSILLVTDGDTGFRGGGVINFIDTGTSVRFEISLVSAGRARLRIDSALLGVAVRVEREPQAWAPCTELGIDPNGGEHGCVISWTIMSIRRV